MSDYGMSVNQICEQALKKINVIGPGQGPLSQDYMTDAVDALYLVAKENEHDGLHQWRQRQGSLKLVNGQPGYEFGGEDSTIVDANDEVITYTPIRILSLRAREEPNGSIRKVHLGSREEYYTLSNRNSQGTVVQAFFDRTIFDKTMYVWPIPNTDNQVLEFTYEAPFVDTRDVYYGDEIYFPDRWAMYLIYAVAHFLALDFSREDKVSYLERQMEKYHTRALNFDQDNGSIQFTPG